MKRSERGFTLRSFLLAKIHVSFIKKSNITGASSSTLSRSVHATSIVSITTNTLSQQETTSRLITDFFFYRKWAFSGFSVIIIIL